MLVHQNWSGATLGGPGDPGAPGGPGGEGPPIDTVKITNRTVFSVRFSGTCHSGIIFRTSGVLNTIQANGGNSVVPGEWLVTGTASTFYLQRTIISGTLQSDPGGGFLQLNTTRTYEKQKNSAGNSVTVVFFELAADAGGTDILDTATMTFECEQGGV